MHSSIVKQTDGEVTLKVTLDAGALKPIVAKTLDELRPRVKAAGFRPGKAPDHIIERELGSDVVQHEVLESALGQSYGEAVQSHALPVVDHPQVSVTKFVPFDELEYTATVEVIPPIKLPDYKKIKQAKPKVEVKPEEIDQVIQDLRQRLAGRTIANRPAKAGDEVSIDFEGSKAGQPVKGASATNYTLTLGSNQFIPGFEDQLVGLKDGDEKTFDIKFPADYGEASMAGQMVTFKIKLHQVFAITPLSVDDKLAELAGPFKTLGELKTDIESKLKEDKGHQAQRQFENAVLDQLIGQAKVNVPKSLSDRQVQNLKLELEQNLAYQGLDWEKYQKAIGKTAEQIEDELRPEADKRVILAIMLAKIAEAEDLKVADSEIDAELARLKASYPDPQFQSQLERQGLRDEIRDHLLSRKAIDKIMSYVQEKA